MPTAVPFYKSRKFWFSWAIPIAIQTVAVLLGVITPAQYIGALTATTSVYAASVAYEDGEKSKAVAVQAQAAADVKVAQVEKQTATIEAAGNSNSG